MRSIDIISAFNAYHIQILLPLILFCIGKERRKGLPFAAAIMLCLLYIAFPFAYRAVTGQEIWICSSLYIGWYNVSYVLYWVLSMGIFGMAFPVQIKALVYYGIGAYLFQNFTFSIRSVVRITVFDGYTGIGNSTLGIFVTVLMLLFFYFYMVKRLRLLAAEDTIENGSLIIFLLFVLFVVNIFSQYWTSHTVQIDYMSIDLNGTVLTTVCDLVMLMLQFSMLARTKVTRDKETMEQLLTELERQHRASAQNIEIINRKCHDLKHQISAMRTMEPDARNRSIDELEEAVIMYDSSFRTGCPTLDTLLTEKSLLCGREQIQITCIA